MWLFVGAGRSMEPVPEGREAQRSCEKCGRSTVFYEKRMTRRVSLFFVDLVAFAPKYVMACGACGAAFAVDDAAPADGFFETQKGTALGVLGTAAGRARAALQDGTAAADAQRVAESASDAAKKAGASAAGWVKRRWGK